MSNRNVRLIDIARYTNNAVSTVSTWRRGRVPKKEQTILKLSQILSVKRDYLLCGKCGKKEIIFCNENDSKIFDNPEESLIDQIKISLEKIKVTSAEQEKELSKILKALKKMQQI